MSVDEFIGGHHEAYRAVLLNNKDVKVGDLNLVDGSLNWNAFQDSKCGGDVVIRTDENVNWLNHRVGIRYVARKGSAFIDRQLVVGLVLDVDPDRDNKTTTLTIADKNIILVEDELTQSLSYPVGTVVVATVRLLVKNAAGAGYVNVPDVPVAADGKLKTAMSWEVGTPLIRVINDLLGAINYSSLDVDGDGVFWSGPYIEPDDRPQRYDFLPGQFAVSSPQIEDNRDMFNIPNRLICIGTSDGDVAPLRAVAENHDPKNPYSFENRGRWLSRTDTDVEAASQDALSKIANRRLVTASQVTWRQTIRHLRVKLELNWAVRSPDGHKATVVEMSQDLRPGEMTTSVIRRQDTMFGEAPAEVE